LTNSVYNRLNAKPAAHRRRIRKSTKEPPLDTPITAPIIVWFRNDLRLFDHPALDAAARSGGPVICLYVLDESPHLRTLGGAARWWLAQSLRALDKGLRAIGGTLVLRRGAATKVVPALAREAGAQAVFWNEIAQAPHRVIERELAAALAADGVTAQGFPGDHLARPEAIRGKDGRGLRVFTPFWKRVLALGDPPSPLPAPTSLRPAAPLASEPIELLGLEPTKPDWASGLRETWQPGEPSAQARLKQFLEHGASTYSSERDRPDRDVTSSLSRPRYCRRLLSQRRRRCSRSLAAPRRDVAANTADRPRSPRARRSLQRKAWQAVSQRARLARLTCQKRKCPASAGVVIVRDGAVCCWFFGA
jgi:deoxyribodipyrimidine photo-lyase